MKTKTKPKTNPKKPHHTSSNVTRSGALPVLEGYWIFPFPGNTIKVSTISKLKKVSFYTSQLEAYLSLADEWFADSIWTEHLQPRPTKVERRFWWFLSHQLLGVTFNTGVVHVGTQYAILYHKKGKYLIKKSGNVTYHCIMPCVQQWLQSCVETASLCLAGIRAI